MDLASGRRPRASPMTWSILERKGKVQASSLSYLLFANNKQREEEREYEACTILFPYSFS